jgi:hypothetical protein
VTGPIFDGPEQRLGHVEIPAETCKAIYDPTIGLVGAYVAANKCEQDLHRGEFDTLSMMKCIDMFPALLEAAKELVTSSMLVCVSACKFDALMEWAPWCGHWSGSGFDRVPGM